jgi:flagellar motor switch protein FliG
MAASVTTPNLPAPPILTSLIGPGDNGTVSGLRKAAILLTTLGDQACAPILRELKEDEVHEVTREISLLRQVSEQERQNTLREFLEHALKRDYFSAGGLEYATSLLMAAFGPEAGKRISERVLKSIASDMPNIDAIRKADPEHLAKVIHREHPQAIALILCHLGSSNAAQLLHALPTDLRADVTRRMAGVDQISPEVINRITKSVGAKLRILGETSMEAYGGVRAVAEVLNRVESSVAEDILGQIAGEDPSLEQTIRHLMFVFDDLMNVSKEALRTLLGRVDRKVLTMALKGCTPQIKQHFTSLMSARAAEMLNEDMQALGPVRIREVEEAQQKVIAIARELQAQGIISLQAAAAERFVE